MPSSHRMTSMVPHSVEHYLTIGYYKLVTLYNPDIWTVWGTEKAKHDDKNLTRPVFYL